MSKASTDVMLVSNRYQWNMYFWLHLLAETVAIAWLKICRRCSPQPTSLCRTCPAPVIEGQAHREAVGPKILPTYPLEGCPLRQNALSSRAGASAKSCEPT